ncbi:MAG: MoxR family ATPase [Alphaproteobacteria bacterium]|nr:MoxR family ATPase [Alphaproteobacteria bacterium]
MTTELQKSFSLLRVYLNERILAQPQLIDSMLIALLINGHLLVEGLPGLAKTKAVKTLAACLDVATHRIQFTPDLEPRDITGADIFRPESNSYVFYKGPLFRNLVLADEINRAPAKVQSALLEAMGERQVTIGNETYRLPDIFLVMATQNAMDQDGTYVLPAAQLDRFSLFVRLHYPALGTERAILDLVRNEEKNQLAPFSKKLRGSHILAARQEVLDVVMPPDLQDYIIRLVLATREPQQYGADLDGLIRYGASPRGTIALDACVRAKAWLEGRGIVTLQDIRSLVVETLHHRIALTPEAVAQKVSIDKVLETLTARVPVQV